MNMRTYKDIEGIWNNEPTHLEWIDKDTDLPCIIKRHPVLGHLCGYVVIPANCKLSELNLVDVDDEGDIRVHGGITFHGFHLELQKNVIGFDCGHYGDLVPGMIAQLDQDIECRKHIFDEEEKYRDIEYVQHECKNLAKQIAEFKCTEKSDSSGIGAKE
jgi:hypothetical protein